MTGQNISSLLKQLRKTSSYSANDVVTKLRNYGIDISAKTLYGYESGLSMPNADTFISLCQIYKCDNPLDLLGRTAIQPSEYKLLEKYRKLDEHGRVMVDFTLEKEYERSISKPEHIIEVPRHKLNAAHTRTDVPSTVEGQLHDNSIMDDDNEWK